ncbi:shikimate kinase [Fulvivirga ligni]|uniref:shikimate kinase n=1 Tax=Fulvivirga ligni TaxID=2904246 RepID=UPI001F479575|nr:shikimate kinase [Fulvivirga ligni]UII21759.1 shikimate kinase [Fulvivirga ligni]
MFNKIVLVGMPGSGKTTVGKQLASELNLPFIDMDEEIVSREGKSVADIFAEYGEEHFRSLEHQVLAELLSLVDGMVVATGGGAPCFHNNMDLINEKGISVFINETVEEIVARMDRYELEKRPKLASSDVVSTLKELHLKRKDYYNKAHLEWNAKESISELIKRINTKG